MAGATTKHIRLGSGGVQSGHRTALSVVEEFGLLDAMYPGRIDLGIGRSGGRTFFKDKLERSDGKGAGGEQPVRPTGRRDLLDDGRSRCDVGRAGVRELPRYGPRFN